jgi:hypothetical protein
MPRRESRSRWSYRAMVVPVPALGLFIVDNATAQRVRVARMDATLCRLCFAASRLRVSGLKKEWSRSGAARSIS